MTIYLLLSLSFHSPFWFFMTYDEALVLYSEFFQRPSTPTLRLQDLPFLIWAFQTPLLFTLSPYLLFGTFKTFFIPHSDTSKTLISYCETFVLCQKTSIPYPEPSNYLLTLHSGSETSNKSYSLFWAFKASYSPFFWGFKDLPFFILRL